jgi:hypothetical protein
MTLHDSPHFAHRPIVLRLVLPRRALALWCCLGLGLLPGAARAQAPQPPLRLDRLVPGGTRGFVTDAWGTMEVGLTNLTDSDRQARVLLGFDGQPDVQYGRDIWVPARSGLTTWMLVGPAPGTGDFRIWLYDRTGGTDRQILPRGEERLRSRGVIFRPREPFTTIVLDHPDLTIPPQGKLPQPMSRDDEAVLLVRTVRRMHKLSDLVVRVEADSLPPADEAFEGIDYFVLASNRLAHDAAGMEALRRWLEQGGRVWVMLDRVEPAAFAPLLGDALDFEIVDRVTLTSFKVETPAVQTTGALRPKPQEHDLPVDFVRVLLPAQERVRHLVGRWPAWFIRSVGRGKVLFTTLGPRGWIRYPDPASVAAATPPLEAIVSEMQPAPDPFDIEAFRQPLGEEIGYSIIGRSAVGLIFAGFILATATLGIWLRKSSRRELLGWVGPVAALGAASAFVALGESSRRAVPATVAVAQIVEAIPGMNEGAIHGMLAAYQPDSGPAKAGATGGGFFHLDMAGLEGQTRRLILTDQGSWHWEDLALPAGERFAPFRYTARTDKPMTAVARLGNGVEGRLAVEPFHDLADALLCTPSGRNLAVHLEPDGAFHFGSEDVLPSGQFLASAVLDEQRQRRHELYRTFLKRPGVGPLEGRNVLLAWALPIDMHFQFGPEARQVGMALLVLPLRLERTPPGTAVTIPGPFVPYRRIQLDPQTGQEYQTEASVSSTRPADQRLRFQLPAEVLPLRVQRARLTARIRAPGRRVTISGVAADKLVERARVDSPHDPITIYLDEEPLLRLDEAGGLRFEVDIGDTGRGGLVDEKWEIEYLELEVSGQTLERSKEQR